MGAFWDRRGNAISDSNSGGFWGRDGASINIPTASGNSSVSISEAVTAGESSTAVFAFASSVTETATPSDSIVANAAFAGAITETTVVTDSPAATAAYQTNQNETAAPADQPAAPSNYSVTLTENSTPGESSTAVAGKAQNGGIDWFSWKAIYEAITKSKSAKASIAGFTAKAASSRVAIRWPASAKTNPLPMGTAATRQITVSAGAKIRPTCLRGSAKSCEVRVRTAINPTDDEIIKLVLAMASKS